jgi:hypothetical protein
VATFAAGIGALMGNRTAFLLLVALFLSLVVPLPLWAMLGADAAIIALILRNTVTLPDKLILSLFPVAWFAYGLPSPSNYWAAYAVVCVQLILCAPMPWNQRGLGEVSHGPLREVKYGDA